MEFKVLPYGSIRPKAGTDTVFLIKDNWDDWFSFCTSFNVYIFDTGGKLIEPGSIKIGQRGLRASQESSDGARNPAVPAQFTQLGEDFFTIGLGNVYYETLTAELANDVRDLFFKALRDCAYDLSIFKNHKDEKVMQTSLLRSITEEQLLYKLSRLAHGNVELTRFNFKYTYPPQPILPSPVVGFSIDPASNPPSNVHVVIGRNGVGKTRFLRGLAHSILRQDPDEKEFGKTTFSLIGGHALAFSGLIAVSFSAFDSFSLPELNDVKQGMKADMIGIRHYGKQKETKSAKPQEPGNTTTAQGTGRAKTTEELHADIKTALGSCRANVRRSILEDAINTLAADDLFEEAKINDLLMLPDEEWDDKCSRLLKRLSSGHAIVLLTIARLAELVEERTIILLDEPEGHLHPPLLSAFVRALSNLLVSRNGVAIIATHSPVILQEVPSDCVWHINRSGLVSKAERPRIETFGENVGVLTNEIFRLQVIKSGYHTLIQKALDAPDSTYESVIESFDGKLGSEARGIVMGLLALKAKDGV